MTLTNAAEKSLHVGAVTGRYVLGDRASLRGVNVFACRLRSVSPTSFSAAAPVVGRIGDPITASFGPFGTLRGRIARHLTDGFAVDVEAGPVARDELAARIDAFRERVWTGVGDKRAEKRFMPSDPRSVIILEDRTVLPCLVVDYSASGAAVSADITPAFGQRMTIGQVAGRVVRLFDVAFALHFEDLQPADDIEALLAAPDEWRDAVAVIRSPRIDTDEGERLELTDYGY